MLKSTALIIVDMQNYYLDKVSDFFRYAVSRNPEAMNYISERCGNTVIPNINRLLEFFRNNKSHVIYLKLCGKEKDRSDLHRIFRKSHIEASEEGYKNIYPLVDDTMADIDSRIKPKTGEKVFDKTTFSAFTSTGIDNYLKKNGIQYLVFTGLATSQCVETTARDASDHGYSVIHIDDAEADYREQEHAFSIINSNAVCGGWVIDAISFIEKNEEYLALIRDEERFIS